MAGRPSARRPRFELFYTFEWPVLAGIALVGWWQLIHEDPETRAARLREREQVDQADRRAEW